MTRTRGWAGEWLRVAVIAGVLTGAAGAQTHKVTKPEQVVRAVGVYEWTGDLGKPTASRLVPVTVFIDGELHDGGAYLPQPIPLALDPGNEYEVERAGVPQGLLRLDYARRLEAAAGDVAADESAAAWMGYGTYKPESAAQRQPPLRASRTQPAITTSHDESGHPTLTRKTDTGGASPDADRPTIGHRSDSGASPSGSSTPGNTPSGSSGGSSPAPGGDSRQDTADDPDRPTLRRRTAGGEKKSKRDSDAPTVKAIGSLNDDPDRPNLHHGRPTGAGQGDEVSPPKLVGTPSSIHQVAAISDAASRPEHDFARPWSDPAERASVLARMQGLARAQLATYAKAPDAAVTTGGGTAKTPAHRQGAASSSITTRTRSAKTSKAAPASVSVALLDEQLQGYTLSYGALPVYVYTAHTAGTGADERYVTIVTQDEVGGDMRPVLQSVTDAAHLDRTPWMRFVDVVDAEASNRASLLFELRGASERTFALYRVLGDRADQLLATAAMP